MTREEKLLTIYRFLWKDSDLDNVFAQDWGWIYGQLQDGYEDNVTDVMLDLVLEWMEK